MTNTIHKFALMTSMEFMLFHGRGAGAVSDELAVIMPAGARILSADVQHGAPVVWAVVPVSRVPLDTTRKFRLVYTGAELPPDIDPDRHIRTMNAGPAVVHLFEVT